MATAHRRARIVSLVPSVTETLAAWDNDPIACTRFCERPDLPHVGGTKDPDVAAIAALRPDLVVIDTEENRVEDFETLVAQGLLVHPTSVRSLGDVEAALTSLADAVGTTWRAPAMPAARPVMTRAFVPIWRRPWMALGSPTYGSSLLAHLGVGNVYEDAGAYPTVELDDAASREADVVLAPSEPYPFTKRQLPELERVARTVFIDGKDLFWWGVRTAEAIERLGAVVASLVVDRSR